MTQDDPERMQVHWQAIAQRMRYLFDATLKTVEGMILSADPEEVVTTEHLEKLADIGYHVFILEQSAANMASRISRDGGYQS